MTDLPESAVERAFEEHDAFLALTAGEQTEEATGDEHGGEENGADPDYRVTTTAFDGAVAVPDGSNDGHRYELVVRTPTLEAATGDEVGASVAVGWFETFKQRLGDASGATRHEVVLSAFGVAEDGDEVLVRYEFEESNPETAAAVAKTFTEYVEGTYVEGVVPGYEYEGPVAELIGRAAAQGSEGEAGGTPL